MQTCLSVSEGRSVCYSGKETLMDILDFAAYPSFPAGTVLDTHNAGDGHILFRLDPAQLDTFVSALTSQGWMERYTSSVRETEGKLYEKNGTGLYVYANSRLDEAWAVYGAGLPESSGCTGNLLYDTVLFYQVQCRPEHGGGMTYFLRLRDGKFIVIDGGFDLDGQEMLETLASLHPEGDPAGTFEIAAWIITHPRCDHVHMLFHVMDAPEVLDRLQIRQVYCNLPCEELLAARDPDVMDDTARLRRELVRLEERGCRIYKPYAGMRFALGETEMQILYSQAEWMLRPMKTVNDASLVLKLISKAGKSVLILGDVMSAGGDVLLEMYSPASLHADAVQVAHHALYGPDFPLYEAIAPGCCFWPMTIAGHEKYGSMIPRNDRLRGMGIPNYLACSGTYTLEL